MSPNIDSPSGLDIFPPEPSVRRVSKRVGILVVSLFTIVFILVIYGLYRRHQTRGGTEDPGNPLAPQATPATSAGHTVASDVPLGNMGTASATRLPRNSLDQAQAPDVLDTSTQLSGAPGSRRYPTEQATLLSAEPTAEDRQRQTEYEREQQAMDAPTGIRGGAFSLNPEVGPDPLLNQ